MVRSSLQISPKLEAIAEDLHLGLEGQALSPM